MKIVEIKHPLSPVKVIRAHSIELNFYYKKMYKLFSGCDETEFLFSLLYDLEADISLS